MAAKTPIRTVYNSDNVATGLAEFQAADFISLANGGTGASLSIGSAGQVLRVNSGATALEFASKEDLADITSIGSTLTAPSNADFTITTAGTGNIVLNDLSISDNKIHANRSNDDLIITASGTGNVVIGAVTISGTTLSAADSSQITVAEALQVDGQLTNANVSITGGTITGITDITVADGGTGASTFTDGGVLLGSGTGAITAMAELSDGEMIVGDGSGDPVAESGATLRTSIGVGTGDSPQFTGIELGHASDTTLTKASSGDIAIEGNIVYRAGGTDVPVSDGGTGASSLTDNAVLTGTGSSAITAEGNLSFDGSTLAVTGAATVSTNLTVTGIVQANNIAASDSSSVAFQSPVEFQSTVQGITSLKAAGLTYPTSDGSAGQFMKTDGSGNLSFATVSIGDLSIVGATIAAPSNAPLTLISSGSSVDIEGLSVAGNVISTTDSSAGVEITGNLIPSADGVYQLGIESRRWQTVYVLSLIHI